MLVGCSNTMQLKDEPTYNEVCSRFFTQAAVLNKRLPLDLHDLNPFSSDRNANINQHHLADYPISEGFIPNHNTKSW